MRNDNRSLEAPMHEHLGEYYSLHIERRALLRTFAGSPVPGHIVPMDMIAPCKVRNNSMLRERRPWPAVGQHERRPASKAPRGYSACRRLHDLIKFPRHQIFSAVVERTFVSQSVACQ